MKLAVFDIDGTMISQKDHSISETTVTAFNKLKERKINLAVASGRSILAIDKRLIRLDVFDYFICGNGTLITDKNGGKLYVSEIGPDVIQRQLEDAIKFDGLLQVNYEKGMDILYGMDKIFRYCVHFLGEKGAKELLADKRKEGKITNGKCFIMDEQMEYYKNRYPEIRFIPAQFDQYYDFVNKKSSKGEALKQLMKITGITRDDVIAFGDDYNDIEMLEAAGTGVAMGNSNSMVKRIADYVTTDCEKDGIYNALRNFNVI